jgi:hypothetical protein
MVQSQNPDELVMVFDNKDLTLVSIARDALASVEIESFIFDENSSRLGYGYGRYTSARLMVRSEKADAARECLRDLGIDK